MKSKLHQYSVLYTVYDDDDGTILEENSEIKLRSSCQKCASNKLKRMLKRVYNALNISVMIHHVEKVKDGQQA